MKIIKKKLIQVDSIIKKREKLSDILNKKNKVLVCRNFGGLGDILNTRPLFKTIKSMDPQFHVTYAVPREYCVILEDHPYIDELIDCANVDFSQYGYIADISSDCGRYENAMRPRVDKHRSDIWAEISLGIELEDHDFQMRLDESLRFSLESQYLSGLEFPRIAIFPRSASSAKDLQDDVLVELIGLLRSDGLDPIVVHSQDCFSDLGLRCISGLNLKDYVHLVASFDYAISVDTGAFHLTAALEIPCVGIFPWTDGKVLSKYHKKCVVVQKHRDFGGPKECPCWDWPSCPHHVKNTRQIPLKCMRDISAIEIKNAFDRLRGEA